MACRAGAVGCVSERCLRRVRHDPRVSSMASASSRASGAPHDSSSSEEWAVVHLSSSVEVSGVAEDVIGGRADGGW